MATPSDSPNKLSIENIPTHLDDAQVKELLEAFGELKSFVVVKEHGSDQHRGVAFCEYVNQDTTDLTIEGLNTISLGEVNLKVQRASVGTAQSAALDKGKELPSTQAMPLSSPESVKQEVDCESSPPSKVDDVAELQDDKPQNDADNISLSGSWEAVPVPGQEKGEPSDDKMPYQMSRAYTAHIRGFFKAASCGQIEILSPLLDEGVDINGTSSKGFTALVVAIQEGQVEALRFLLERGADPSLRVRELPPLVHAVENPDHAAEMVQLLLDHGAPLNTEFGPLDMTVLHAAVVNDKIDVVELLLQKGMDTEKRDGRDRTPLILAAHKPSVAAVLLQHGADMNVQCETREGGTVIACSSHLNNVDALRFWLDKGLAIDGKDKLGRTPLHIAALCGHADALKFLLEKGADVSTSGPNGLSALMFAVVSNDMDTLKVLLSHGCDVDAKNQRNETALDYAYIHGKQKSAQVLIQAMSRGVHHPDDSVALQLALAAGFPTLKCLISGATLMYPHIGSKSETPGEFAWMEWVLNEGGPLVKPLAMMRMLQLAVYDGNVEMAKALISQGCPADVPFADSFVPLSGAVEKRNIPMIKVLLDAGADPNMPEKSNSTYTPFDVAIQTMVDGNDTEIVELLLNSGRCLINKGPDDATTAFSYILLKTRVWASGLAESLAIKMIDSVTDVNEDRCADGNTLLHVATYRGRADIAEILLKKGANIEATNASGITPFLLACQVAPKLIPFYLAKGANLHARFKDNTGAIAAAIAGDSIEALERLIDLGLDIDERTGVTDANVTPLGLALTLGRERAALFLIHHGANMDLVTEKECNIILHLAVNQSLVAVVRELIKRGRDVNLKDSSSWAPLHEACVKGNTKIVDMLLKAGANMEEPSPDGNRPLHIALINKNQEIPTLLLERGADISARGAKNRTPLHLAARYMHPFAARILLEKGASTEVTDDDTHFPLHCCQHPHITRMLLAHGADINCKDKDNWSPIHGAVYNCNFSVAEVLLRAGAAVSVRTTDDGRNAIDRMQDCCDEKDRGEFYDMLQALGMLDFWIGGMSPVKPWRVVEDSSDMDGEVAELSVLQRRPRRDLD